MPAFRQQHTLQRVAENYIQAAAWITRSLKHINPVYCTNVQNGSLGKNTEGSSIDADLLAKQHGGEFVDGSAGEAGV